jgi:hypothetical protein
VTQGTPHIPEAVREYFGHDKVAHHGSGGLPAAPPAPPGSTGRKAGETALADAMRVVGTPGRRPGDFPAVLPPKPQMARRMRAGGERAMLEASQRRFAPAVGQPAPHAASSWFWRSVFAPVYSVIPWALKRRMVAMGTGVKGWRR